METRLADWFKDTSDGKVADAIRNAEGQLASFDTYWTDRPKSKTQVKSQPKPGKSRS